MKFLKLLPYNINSPWRGEGVMEFTITCLLTQRRPIWVKIGAEVLEEKMLTDDGRRTTDYGRRRSI